MIACIKNLSLDDMIHSIMRHLFRAMESQPQKENLGTVYFPVSLLLLSLLCFGGYLPIQCSGNTRSRLRRRVGCNVPFAVASAATLAEAVTPFGLDNLSVPLVSSFTYYCLTVLI